MKLAFTSQEPSKKGSLHKENKTRERPQRKSLMPKTEKPRRNIKTDIQLRKDAGKENNNTGWGGCPETATRGQ